MEITKINDEDPVVLFVHLKSGCRMSIGLTAKLARGFIKSWREYVSYYMAPEHLRTNLKPPFYSYQFYDGDLDDPKNLEKQNIKFLTHFVNVEGAQYEPFDVIADKEQKDLIKKQGQLFDIHLKEVRRGEGWRGD